MQVNLISFLDPTKYSGGGEMISKALIDAGLKRGHDIRISSMRPKKINEHKNPDLILFIDVFNNAHTLKSLGAWRSFEESYIIAAMQRAPFVHLTNAYADVCNLPYLPCNGASAFNCLVKEQISFLEKLTIKDFSRNCFSTRKLVRELHENAALNVYLSPLHRQISETVTGIKKVNSFVLRPLIDTSTFYDRGLTRDIEYLFVGIIGEAKGFYEMRDQFKDKDIHFIGKIAPGINLDFGKHYGHVNYNEIPNYMNRAKNFVFLPRWPEPQGRVVVEAALCGCNILGNDNVGALSFQMDLGNPQNYEGVEEEFWLKLEQL